MTAQVIGTTEKGMSIWGGTSADRTALGVKPSLTQFQEIGGNLYESDGSAWNPIGTTGVPRTANMGVEPGHDKNFDRTWGGGKANPSANKTASAQIKATPGKYFGYTVIAVTATAAIYIRNGTDATGEIKEVIPIGTAAGATKALPYAREMSLGIYIDFNGGTGTVFVDYL